MSFISLAYLVFFPIVCVVHFLLPAQRRWIWLLLASCYFYAYFVPRYLLILFFIIAADWSFARWMEPLNGRSRRLLLYGSLATNLGLLFVFKYFNFFNAESAWFAHQLGLNYTPPVLDLVLPIGLSFHTFQAMSYTLEVFWGRQSAERHLGVYALYVLFFPQLVAGPIERPQNLLPQLHTMPEFKADAAVAGLRLILIGVFKKVVLADRLAVFVDGAFNGWRLTTGLAFWFAAVCFAFQIYYDFSAYTDIARGSAKILGIELMKNFNFPYFAHSPRKFWTRWHISLSTWFRDYVYVPLGGSRVSRAVTVRNLFVVFLLSGLWHGANLSFVVWGLLNFVFVALPLYLAPRVGLPIWLRTFLTFSAITVAWIFFRAPDLSAAGEILTEMILLRKDQLFLLANRELQIDLSLIVAMTACEWIWVRSGETVFLRAPVEFRWAVYYLMIVVIFACGVFGQKQFIYFQF